MALAVGARLDGLARRQDIALALLHAWHDRPAALREAVAREESWLVGEPLESLLAIHEAPPPLSDYTVIASDGSSIDLDRHGLTQCCLINVGAALIRYGARPHAALSSAASLYYTDEDLSIAQVDGGRKGRLPLQGAMVDLKRTLAEQRRALDLAAAVGDDVPVVVVLDGTLLLWRLAGRAAEEEYVAEALRAYGAGLERFHDLGVPVCSYVSRPNGREVVNVLRLAASLDGDDALPSFFDDDDLLPLPASERSELDAEGAGEMLSDLLEPLTDRALMEHLAPGDRSARFASRSPVLRYYGHDGDPRGHGRIQFSYLNVGDEVARLEFPRWVGDDPATLDLVHTAVYDSCRRGWGYPPALAEAHEKAIIRAGDRDAFLRMVGAALDDGGRPALVSLKQLAKNRRAV